MSRWFARSAHLPTGLASDVLLTVREGRFTGVEADVAEVPADAVRLPGVVLPGFADTHSHAFHRALRGRTHGGGGTFWTWREGMYAVAERLDPDRYLALARAVYAEMALAGVTSAGEFHYLHHGPGGARYDDPNAMAEALRSAAADAGVRLTLLDTAYLAGGLDPERGPGRDPLPTSPEQQRFSDGDVEAWAGRVEALTASSGMRVGAAIHSVRAVRRADLAPIAAVAAERGWVLHAHVAEQPAEVEAARSTYGASPVQLLADAGALGPRSTAVHATHLSPQDVALLAESGTTASICPTTERDLADGIGPARLLADAGVPLSLGSDQHVVVDLFAEAQALEGHERLASLHRGRFRPGELLTAMTAHASIGWDDAGALAVGQRADLVAVRTDTVRTAGADPAQVVLAASAADVDTVVVDGQVVVSGGRHRLGDVGRLLAEAIGPLWEDA